MAWHEIVAWVVIAVAFVTAVVWAVKRIICPASKCEGCDKDCAFRVKKH